jgi:flagellar M-ring protein FliF
MAISLWYGNKVKDDAKIDDAFITQVRQAASTATGIPVNNISVNKLKLASAEEVETPVTDTIRQLIQDYGLFALMLLLIVGMLIMAIPRKKREAQPQLTAADLEAAALAGPKFIVPETGEPIPEIDVEERSEIKKQIEKFVKQKPDAVAQLLRNWISDEWDG